MKFSNSLPVILLPIYLLLNASAFGAGGTSIIAQEGSKAAVALSLPDGVGALINDKTRTTGWNSWFSEWPNDVRQYGFKIESTKDLNQLIVALAGVKSEIREVRLSFEKEPLSIGWVTRLPEANGIAAIFSIGDQSQIDEWYKRVRKPFGVHEFLAAPTAVPPTLTIFVQNEKVDLENLEIPKGITVEVGGLPGVFHRFNTKQEKERNEKAKKERKAAKKPEPLDAESKRAAAAIQKLLKARK